MSHATKAQAKKVLTQVKKQRKTYLAAGYPPPRLTNERLFNWQSEKPGWTIVWEEGPYEWAIQFPYGGTTDWELADAGNFPIPNVIDAMPEGVWSEAHTTWAIGIYSDDNK
jgi:hypothetical protein